MIVEILILAAAIPTGFLITYLARDELIQGRKWFMVLIIAGIILGVTFYIMKRTPESLTSLFIAIVSFVSYKKSKDKKWTTFKYS